jgi:hypothetical protein
VTDGVTEWKRHGKTVVKCLCTNTVKWAELTSLVKRKKAVMEAIYFTARGTKVAQQYVLKDE